LKVWFGFPQAENRAALFGRQWANIEKGPRAFTAREMAIVQARRMFRWRILGVTENGDIRFEIHNGSNMVLPYLTLSVRGKTGKLDGGIWLPVSTVSPGMTRIIEKSCYKEFVKAEDVQVFDAPDPEPEDRSRFWEFRPFPY
jgi:hypothetical protein